MNLPAIDSINLENKIRMDVDHGSRVAYYAGLIADEIRLDEITKKNVICAAKFHDSGKAYLDKRILDKPDKLTEAEFEHVKCHVMFSAIYAAENGMNNDVINNIYSHHENIDGSGYLRGLKGNAIPIGARIIRIADFYDALTSDRVYRKKQNRKNALKVIDDNKNLLDAKILKAFLSALFKNTNPKYFN